MVEPTIFAQAKPRQNGSNLDLLELSRKLKSVTARDDLKMLENISKNIFMHVVCTARLFEHLFRTVGNDNSIDA